MNNNSTRTSTQQRPLAVDMSSQAITTRLREVSELYELGTSLNKARPCPPPSKPATMNSIGEFLHASSFAVAGASQHRSKYGNKVFLAIAASGRTVYPLNLTASEVEGQIAYASISDLPQVAESLSIVTPPHITREVVQQAIAAGVKNLWMQPGAEDAQASQAAREAGLNVIDDGSCILVLLAREEQG